MTSFLNKEIPPPKSGKEFEKLCRDLWRRIWKDPEAKMHGRSGYAQQGVDIYGRPERGDEWAGVQCKVRNNQKLTKTELLAEVEKAKSFEPKLSEYIIATTGRIDPKIQEIERCITLEHQKKGLFSVSIWFWEDIHNILAEHDELINKYYSFLTISQQKDDSNVEHFGLNWLGKAKCMEIIQKPSVATLKPIRKESVNFYETENMFIEGENLEALKLLQKDYVGKIKMIYVDPPYNTRQVDDNGRKFSTNPDTDGRYHSHWLNMMYPRLYLAHSLLREDGVIFLFIDDNEVANLRALCDVIFRKENFITQLVLKSRQMSVIRNKTNVSTDHEYVLVYAKKLEEAELLGKEKEIDADRYSNPDNDSRGPWMSNSIHGIATSSQRPNLHYPITDPNTGTESSCPPDTGWRYSQETMKRKISDGRIIFSKDPTGRPREKKFLSEIKSKFTALSSIIPENIGYMLNGIREVRDLMDGRHFGFSRPTSLVKFLVEQGTSREGDTIIDLFAGFATTAHAVMQLNAEDGGRRKYICVQSPEPIKERSEAYKAGYETIADIGKERIRRAAKQIEDEQKDQPDLNGNEKLDLGFKVFKLDQSNLQGLGGHD